MIMVMVLFLYFALSCKTLSRCSRNLLLCAVVVVVVVVVVVDSGVYVVVFCIVIQSPVKVFKKPVGPLVGFVSQFLFMPLFSFLVGWIITDDYLFR